MKRSATVLLALAFVVAFPALGDEDAEEARLRRRLALVEELRAEGAEDEARLVLAEACGDLPAPAPKEARGRAPGLGATFARGVVKFYRFFIAPAIGQRCVLEPSCSSYFLEASRKHGLLGIPMTADRFVREPPESHSDRMVRRADGSWRHADPVEDHDWWF
jgi:putative component of membrane protein insertase Oxa1/YidC/SpoIIIJ protein YidD